MKGREALRGAGLKDTEALRRDHEGSGAEVPGTLKGAG